MNNFLFEKPHTKIKKSNYYMRYLQNSKKHPKNDILMTNSITKTSF
jgi:hypothetical protein